MHEAWWVYAIVAFACTFLYILAKIAERYVDDDGMISMIAWVVGLIAFLAAFKTADMLKLFS